MFNAVKQLFFRIMKREKSKVRFILYFTVLNLLVAGILSTFLYFFVSNALERETIESNRNALIQLNTSTDILLNQVERFLTQLSVNPDILDFINYYQRNDLENADRVNTEIGNIVMSNEYFYSTEIYYLNENKVYLINGGLIDLKDYNNRDNLIKIRDNFSTTKIVPSAKIMEPAQNNRVVNVISIVKSIPQDGTKPVALAVVNIEEGYLRSIINSMVDKNKEEVYIVDDKGNIISKNRTDRKYEAMINQDFLNNVIKSSDGFSINKFNNEKVLISYVTSDNYGWKYISFTPYNSVIRNVTVIKNYSLVVSLLAVIIGIIVSLFFSNKISGPINAIASLFKNNKSLQEEKDVFKYIHKNVNELVEKNETLEKTLSDHIPILKNNFLTGVLLGTIPDSSEIEERFSYYGIDMAVNEKYLVCLMSLESYSHLSSRYSERQINMLVVYLIQVLNELVNKNNKGIVFNTNTNEIAIILSIPNNMKGDYKILLNELGGEIRKTILENIKYTTAVAIGNVYEGISEIYRSYEEAQEALNYRVLMGSETVIFYDEIKSLKEDNNDYPYKRESELMDSLKQGDLSHVTELNNEVFKAFICCNNAKNEIVYYYMQLLNSTIKCAFELGLNIETLKSKNNLYKEILSIGSAAEAQEWFRQLFSEIAENIALRKDTKNEVVVKYVEEYIRENYDKDLSLINLAESVYLSVPYLSKIFKETRGITIKQVINEVRIEKAKEFLKNPKYRVSEVAEKVGYDKIHGFLKLFKDATGMTPGEYRTKVVREETES